MLRLSADRVKAVPDVGIGDDALAPSSSWGRPMRRVMSMVFVPDGTWIITEGKMNAVLALVFVLV
jgi:hypothetical protein